ncbi:Pkinase-domain-containing protein [Exidia glandulosa HHB12029]|uniref:Pkinase-domain-containing protein n=1 Tax=Exidia glandulosa HHB12029 TaxID=1314781 RepID=A0A165M9W1_EXIGL|nr:Pkinase-domain-containing protein [Exidia glandulosa HHB12029]
MPAAQTVPCQYRTGKTLGSGTYAVVKEAVHIKTGKYYACKVINKKLMEGREHMVRNEIAVLKKVSSGHRNIVTLHDYFETAHNLYLVFDLCTGGELFDRICAKGNYYEADAAELVRTIIKAVLYIHGCGIVHRDLKPENLLFRSPAEDADIMIADFGLSRVMDDEKFKQLTEICGTPGYMAPEIFRKSGHGKPVDIWAMGVITYFLLCGYTPFDRDTQQEEMEAIIAGDYKFEPKEYWANVSEVARDFVRTLLTVDPTKRPTAQQALEHPWLASSEPHFVADPTSPTGGPKDLLPNIKESFNARKTFRKAVLSMMAMNRLSHHALSPRSQFALNVDEYRKAAEDENVDEEHNLVYGHPSDGSHSRTPSSVGTPTSPLPPTSPAKDHLEPPTGALERTKLSDD